MCTAKKFKWTFSIRTVFSVRGLTTKVLRQLSDVDPSAFTEETRSWPYVDVIGHRFGLSASWMDRITTSQLTAPTNTSTLLKQPCTTNSQSLQRHVVSHKARNPVGLTGRHSTSLSDQHPFTELTNRSHLPAPVSSNMLIVEASRAIRLPSCWKYYWQQFYTNQIKPDQCFVSTERNETFSQP